MRALAFALLLTLPAGDTLPTLAASTPFLDVDDGSEHFEQQWMVGAGSAEQPQVYVPLAGDEPRTITFRSDQGAVSFDTTAGGSWTFVVAQGTTRTVTRIDRSPGHTPTFSLLRDRDAPGGPGAYAMGLAGLSVLVLVVVLVVLAVVRRAMAVKARGRS